MTVHAIVSQAASGELPSWAEAGERRREHMGRVSDLLGEWAEAMGLDESETVRWRAVGFLHDVLRDADPAKLRERLAPAQRDLPDPILHGPAAAERLRVDGVLDGELLRAVAGHTLGDAAFGRLGRALYAADFLEPGRSFLPEWRAELRARVPTELDRVVREIVGARIRKLIEDGRAVRPETLAFWNTLAEEAP